MLSGSVNDSGTSGTVGFTSRWFAARVTSGSMVVTSGNITVTILMMVVVDITGVMRSTIVIIVSCGVVF